MPSVVIPPPSQFEPTPNILLRALIEGIDSISVALGGSSVNQYNNTKFDQVGGAGYSISFSNFKKADIIVVSGSTVTMQNGAGHVVTLVEGMTISLEATSLMQDTIQVNCASADDRVIIIQQIQ